MNHLIAKIRLRGNAPKYKKLLSDVSLFELPNNLAQHVQYSPDHNLDEDSWFAIGQFSAQAFCLDFLKTPFDTIGIQKKQNCVVAMLSGKMFFRSTMDM